jgi:Putative beta-barrel porin 2
LKKNTQIFSALYCSLSLYVFSTDPVLSDETIGSAYSVEKPVGEIRSRFNILDATRTPLTEIPFSEISSRSFVPARTRREGFIPRITVMEEFNDNILFTPENKLSDFITIISPGFNFVNKTNRSEVELDYSFESTIYPENSQFSEAFETHNLQFSGSYLISDKSSIGLSNTFFSFRDPTNQLIPGVSLRSRVNENNLNFFLAHKVTNKIDLMLGYNQSLYSYEDQSLTNSLIHDGFISLATLFTPQDLIGIEYRYRFVDFSQQEEVPDENTFGAPDGQIHFIALNNRHDFSETWALASKIGLAKITEPVSSTNVIASLSIKASTKDTTLEVRYDRDISTTGGFNTLLEGDLLSASIESALMNKLYGIIRVDASKFRQLYGNGIKVKLIEPSFALEYKFTRKIQFRLSYHYLYQQINIGDIVSDSNKVNLGVVASF